MFFHIIIIEFDIFFKYPCQKIKELIIIYKLLQVLPLNIKFLNTYYVTVKLEVSKSITTFLKRRSFSLSKSK